MAKSFIPHTHTHTILPHLESRLPTNILELYWSFSTKKKKTLIHTSKLPNICHCSILQTLTNITTTTPQTYHKLITLQLIFLEKKLFYTNGKPHCKGTITMISMPYLLLADLLVHILLVASKSLF